MAQTHPRLGLITWSWKKRRSGKSVAFVKLFPLSDRAPCLLNIQTRTKTNPTLCCLLPPRTGLVLVPPHGKKPDWNFQGSSWDLGELAAQLLLLGLQSQNRCLTSGGRWEFVFLCDLSFWGENVTLERVLLFSSCLGSN